MLQVETPEYVTMGGEDTAVYIYDISGQLQRGGKVVNKLQVGSSSLVPCLVIYARLGRH